MSGSVAIQMQGLNGAGPRKGDANAAWMDTGAQGVSKQRPPWNAFFFGYENTQDRREKCIVDAYQPNSGI